jgi:lysyl-tRNA synthetase class 2
MSHVTHLAQQKTILEKRFAIISAIRTWFQNAGFLEVDTPLILRVPGQEPYLSPMPINIHDEQGNEYLGHLHTSPEYTMKKMLAAGFDNIYFLGKVFRDYESFGGTHNPEFTMIEWYRANADYVSLMNDIENLIGELSQNKIAFCRMHMRDLWSESIGVNLDEYLTREKMLELCRTRGFAPDENESYEDLFYRIFLNEIEPTLQDRGGVIIHHYPLPMAALSRPSAIEKGYAERVEVYINGLELANGFSELTDASEQRHRLETESTYRKKIGKTVFDLDEDFIEAVGMMPPSAGIALGVDRLVQILTGCQNINDVLVLPASQLFRT